MSRLLVSTSGTKNLLSFELFSTIMEVGYKTEIESKRKELPKSNFDRLWNTSWVEKMCALATQEIQASMPQSLQSNHLQLESSFNRMY